MVDGTGSPPTSDAGQQPPASQPEVVSTSAQNIISTSAQNFVTVSTLGVQGSGSAAITTTKGSRVSNILSVKQDALSGLLQSGLISTPQQVADLQQQLASLTVDGGMSVPLPPLNVTQVPLFKTSNDSSMFEM